MEFAQLSMQLQRALLLMVLHTPAKTNEWAPSRLPLKNKMQWRNQRREMLKSLQEVPPQEFQKFSLCKNRSGYLFKMHISELQILVPWVWGGVSAFYTSSPGIPIKVVFWSHLEKSVVFYGKLSEKVSS